jgi:hypothetical protein
MSKIVSIEEYFKNKMIQQVVAIKEKLYESMERLELKNRRLELEINTLLAENAALKQVIKQYEKEAKSSDN